MSITPIITFKAGICDVDVSLHHSLSSHSSQTDRAASNLQSRTRSSPRPSPAISTSILKTVLFPPIVASRQSQANICTDLIHFCWRSRDVPLDEPELDLVMIPTDGHFVPFDTRSPAQPTSKTNGRIFVLKFGSSSQRHLFWLQSKPQGRTGNPAWFSPRDLKIGEVVDKLLQGEEVDVNRELASVRGRGNNDDEEPRAGDDDETMEDVEGHGDPHGHHEGGNGGAGPDATGGDFRKEGEGSREGGADGARA